MSQIVKKVSLKLGDVRPSIDGIEWVKNGPIDLSLTSKKSFASLTSTSKKKVLVIEFWATWCPPCCKCIPHVTELAKKMEAKYPGNIAFIGLTQEKRKDVEPFVAEMGSKMDYHVGIDTKKEAEKKIFDASGQRGIPVAFVFNKSGKLVWMDHPMEEGFEDAIEEALME